MDGSVDKKTDSLPPKLDESISPKSVASIATATSNKSDNMIDRISMMIPEPNNEETSDNSDWGED